MKRVRAFFVSMVGGLLLTQPTGTSSATTCTALPPLKPIHRICGVVFFPSGDRIANAKVAVLEAGKEVAREQTGDDGKFSFDQLKAGNYEIQVRVEAVRVATTQVTLVHPEAKSKREIAVSMNTNGCSSFSLVNSEQFEAGLNPR